MKILKVGGSKPPMRGWWFEVVHRCPTCGAEWILEEGDEVIDVVTERSINGESICNSRCPTCHIVVSTLRSQALPAP